jgi:integrase
VADSTLCTESSYVQAFADWLLENEMADRPVTVMPRTVRAKLDRQTSPNFVTTADVLRLLQAHEGLPRRFLTILAGTGMRVGELIPMAPDWWDPGDRLLRIPKLRSRETTKKHKREIPVGPFVAAVIEDAIQEAATAGRPSLVFLGIQGKPLKRQPNQWCSPHGLSPHDLRRWYSNTLLNLDCPDKVREALLGHTLTKRDKAYCNPTKTKPWAEKVDGELRGVLETDSENSEPA